ncbi:hypothetical protein SAMN04488063_0106 [Halopelagius inordinatus]|uniref:Uncharacterized protein n=1 Tax=Halopelagius inordinatus TaxID=553467 RepID=A0A1I2X2C5_9EURY|nr:hypothetical protein [Halopelagius inordinatus]SFH07690.1 hypothetical protein SAMN04488063_0106 [Halopelagius inordinatus]
MTCLSAACNSPFVDGAVLGLAGFTILYVTHRLAFELGFDLGSDYR